MREQRSVVLPTGATTNVFVDQLMRHGDQGCNSMDSLPPYKGPNMKQADPVNSPPHYTEGGIETIDFIEAKRLGYHLGNAVKYISRCQFKGDRKTDVKKAIWYLQRYLKTIETEA